MIYKHRDFIVKEDKSIKYLYSRNANYRFNKENGEMISWGKTLAEDAELFPGPTIADIEISTICSGIKGIPCSFCYKSNTSSGTYMTFETFKKVFDKLPKTLTQIAFGADATLKSNPDIWKIMEYTRANGIVPNITVANIDDETADKLVALCGAVAISKYDDKDVCYDSVKKLTDRGLKQVNIHQMISAKTLDSAKEAMKDYKEDSRLEKLNAIVFLSLKQKGRGKAHQPLSQIDFNEIVKFAFDNDVPIGFDSCSSLKFFKSLNSEQYDKYQGMIMPCESTLESSYINVEGDFYPCSFTEGTENWLAGVSVVDCKDFIDDVWNNPRVNAFREILISTKCNNKFGCRECPIYNI